MTSSQTLVMRYLAASYGNNLSNRWRQNYVLPDSTASAAGCSQASVVFLKVRYIQIRL